jgi:hypothetical protein
MVVNAAGTTVETLAFGLRSGVKGLSAPDSFGRLLELDDRQLSNVVVRLQNFMPHIARAWTPDEIAVLIATRNNALGRTGAVPALPKE